jgi:Dolichyl-phosphate-mannose-protein mannosyltransferase
VRRISLLIVLIGAALLLGAGTLLRSAEYDEQYTLFLTGAMARPAWPTTSVTAGDVVRLQAAHADLARIARDLRATDVHPPLYFWLVALWRTVFGNSLVIARLASVACALGALLAVARIAHHLGTTPWLAMLLTVGCYGFAYTGAIARGFALAQMLTLCGVAVALNPRPRTAFSGVLLGAACFTNYLAAFTPAALLGWLALRREDRRLLLLSAGIAPFLAADLMFFLAQRQTREGQFPPFHALSAIPRIGKYLTAALFGGLPLYVDGLARTAVSTGLALLMLGLSGLIVWRWRRIGTPRAPLAAAAVATPIGLLLLGLAFDTTPIELRYLAFSLPFLALLLAGALHTLPTLMRLTSGGLVLTIQAAAIAGWLTRPETMQPARATAAAAATLVADGTVLLPRGNDGVGIVGAFANEAPAGLRLLLVAGDEPATSIRHRAAGFPRVALALIAQDDSSRAAGANMRDAFADPCWRETGSRGAVLVFQQIGR